MRVCTYCQESHELEKFRIDKKGKDGRGYMCKPCFKVYTKEYEKTERGFLMRSYRNMKSRITGIQKKKAHLYEGKSLLPKEEFYQWAGTSNFSEMFEVYKKSGFDQKLAPSVDRIDSSKGYEIGNIRWITHSHNSSLGSLSRHRKSA